MFESLVLLLLNRHLGEFIDGGFDHSQLKVLCVAFNDLPSTVSTHTCHLFNLRCKCGMGK